MGIAKNTRDSRTALTQKQLWKRQAQVKAVIIGSFFAYRKKLTGRKENFPFLLFRAPMGR